MTSLESLEHLNLSGCSRLNKIPDSVSNMTSLRNLSLNETAIKKLPLSFKRLSSLVVLNISDCSRLEKIPKNLLSGMKCLEYLWVGRSVIRKFSIGSGPDPMISLLLPNSFSCLSYLRELDLSYCNLSDGAIPNDLSCLSSLYYLTLSGNKFTRIPDSVAQLSNLCDLVLNDCSWLQVLPKLPLGLKVLGVKNCPLLESFDNKQMEMWRSSNEKLRSIDYSVVQAYFDYDGNPFKILRLHPRSPVWSKESFQDFDHIACGPALVGSGIPEWFNDKSTNSFGTIHLHSDFGSDKYRTWKGYAVFIVYEFHEPHTTHPRKRRKLKVDERKGNSNSTTIFDGSNSNLPNFVCHFQVDGVDVTKPLVFCAPGVPSVGPNGFWVYIPFQWPRTCWSGLHLKVSITTGSLNVEVKECGARLLRDNFELFQVLNTISPRALGCESYEKLFSRLCNTNCSYLTVWGPIKSNVVASG
ncbi:disease resistance protein RPV1-like [Corylus avellana]|uniref:disease resistance protein RPV1-like n=1 Tax=Corylus avellana TaxID=13451 RepID=UPI00286A1233|nr:disease resistance protein RPV1-like [Corylus avellana]